MKEQLRIQTLIQIPFIVPATIVGVAMIVSALIYSQKSNWTFHVVEFQKGQGYVIASNSTTGERCLVKEGWPFNPRMNFDRTDFYMPKKTCSH